MDYDPNHPPELNIAPSWSRNAKRTSQEPVETNLATACAESNQEESDAAWQRDTQEDIQQWGIAGRIWEAAYLFRRYLTAPTDSTKIEYDPPCPIFDSVASTSDFTLNILELGSGVGYVGLALAQELQRQATIAADKDAPRRKSRIILTDLENVCDLMQRNATSAGFPPPSSADAEVKDRDVEVLVRPLPWGSASHAQDILQTLEDEKSRRQTDKIHPLDYILCSDLVYFPHLLAPLLRSLLDLTSSSHNNRKPPTVLIAYKIRSLAKEEPFWSALSVWFEVEIVNCRFPTPADSQTTKTIADQWHRFGYLIQDLSSTTTSSTQQDETSDDAYFVLIARRKSSTYQYRAPSDDKSLMNGYMLSLSSKGAQEEDQVQKSDNDDGTDDGDGNRDSGEGLIKGSGEGADWLEWALMGDLDFT